MSLLHPPRFGSAFDVFIVGETSWKVLLQGEKHENHWVLNLDCTCGYPVSANWITAESLESAGSCVVITPLLRRPGNFPCSEKHIIPQTSKRIPIKVTVVLLFNTVIYVFLLLCLCSLIVCLCIFIMPAGTLQLPWLRFICAFSSVVRQMPG
jgi:hypothetical protein